MFSAEMNLPAMCKHARKLTAGKERQDKLTKQVNMCVYIYTLIFK